MRACSTGTEEAPDGVEVMEEDGVEVSGIPIPSVDFSHGFQEDGGDGDI